MTRSSSTFRRGKGLARGYSSEQVDRFFTRARVSYEQGGARGGVSSNDVRGIGFDLVRGGYEVAQVDAALDRMEDAFARREQAVVRGRLGADRAFTELSARAATLRSRLGRPDGDRFDREVGLSIAYDVDDVDDLCHRILGYFEDGEQLGPDDIRRAVFRQRRGSRGYSEPQVDAFLDRAVEVFTALR